MENCKSLTERLEYHFVDNVKPLKISDQATAMMEALLQED